MKIRNLFVGAVAALAMIVGCQPQNEDLGTPDISISVNEMAFEAAGGDQQLSVTATRDWKVETDADWVVVSPESGAGSREAQSVTVSVLENTGMDRSADLKFTIGMKSKYLTVSQAGPGGSAEALIVYGNDFDKTKAEKGDKWSTYLDTFDGWRNEKGTGIKTVTYASKSLTARTNSGNGSAGNYSDYTQLGASGMNYLWFGTAPTYFAVKNITLPEGKTDYTLSFGTERYLYEAKDNTYNWDEFSVYVSADAKKWVKLAFDFAGGALPNGRWDLATATFTVPAGTDLLNIYFTSSLGSAYAIDDLKLAQSDEAGTVIDFAAGEEFEVGGDIPGGGGGSTTVPESKGKKTVSEFIAAADANNYYELTGTVSGFNPTYCSFDLTDETGKIYVYSVLASSKAEWSSKIANGGTVTIYGKYLYYEQKSQHEVVDAYIVSYTPGEGGSDTPAEGQPTNLIKATVAEFLAAAESSDVWYELTGEVTSIAAGNAYGNIYINDGTAEVYIYGLTNGWVGYNDKSFDSIGLKVGDTVTLGTLRGSYNGDPQGGGSKVPAFYISHVPGEGGDDPVTPPAGGDGEYDSELTWTLGTNAYDATSSTPQKAIVNDVMVENLLKLGNSAAGGSATVTIPAGTTKVGFYSVAWKGNSSTVLTCKAGSSTVDLNLAANVGATGNPDPTYELTVSDTDYFTVDIPDGATQMTVETTGTSNCRALIFGLKAIAE